MIELLKDPRFGNYLILVLYASNIARWSVAKSWGDASYWFGAFWITATQTWGFSHGPK